MQFNFGPKEGCMLFRDFCTKPLVPLGLQIDVCAEEMSNNVASHVMLVGDIKSVAKQVRMLMECFQVHNVT